MPHLPSHADSADNAGLACPVSIVIPVLDDSDVLQRCLDALRDQTALGFEVVVVDNGSRDDTREVAERAGVTYVFESRRGIPAATAAGFDAARGTVLARLDADSVPPRHWVARVEELFAADADLVGATGPGEFTSLPQPLRRLADVVYMRAYFTVFGRMLGFPPLFGASFAIRRDSWASARERVHRFDSEVHDDLDLSFALGPDAHVVVDPALTVRVSARPFAHPFAFVRRIARALRTVRLHHSRARAVAR